MYVPNHYAESRPEVIQRFLRTNPFCSLVTSGTDGLFATHLPLILDTTQGGYGVLRGHLARANPHRQMDCTQALAIFSGDKGYVSPSFYPSKRKHGRVVPTWNYTVVHVSGPVSFIDDPVFVQRNVEELTALMESNREHPWKLSDAPEDYVAKMLRAIIGIELEIREIRAKFKLSQNRDSVDIQGVIDGLSGSSNVSDHAVAEAMRQNGKIL